MTVKYPEATASYQAKTVFEDLSPKSGAASP